MPTFTGMCRIRGVEGQPNRVRVTDGDLIFEDVDEQSYIRRCYKPPIEELDWCNSGERQGEGV